MNDKRIVRDPNIMIGKPTIKGTRITVQHILSELEVGVTVEELLREHPGLSEQDIRAAKAYMRD